MESISLTPIATASTGSSGSYFCSFRTAVGRTRTRSSLCPRRGRRKFGGVSLVRSSKGDAGNPQRKPRPELNSYDLMELKFGKLLGEDPKLTLAKIMGRKANPEASFLDIERSFYKKKGNLSDVKEVPFEDPRPKNISSSRLADGLNLIRPVPKESLITSRTTDNKPIVSNPDMPEQIVNEKPSAPRDVVKRNVPNVILRKPVVFREDSVEDKPSRLNVKRNLSIRMGDQPRKEKFSQMELLRKPEPANLNSRNFSENEEPLTHPGYSVSENVTSIPTEKETQWASDNFSLSAKPSLMKDGVGFTNVKEETFVQDPEVNSPTSMTGQSSERVREIESLNVNSDVPRYSVKEQDGDSVIGSQLYDLVLNEETTASAPTVDAGKANSSFKSPPAASLLEKPRRLDKPAKVVPPNEGLQTSNEKVSYENYDANLELAGWSTSSSLDDFEEADWARAEVLAKTGEKFEVES